VKTKEALRCAVYSWTMAAVVPRQKTRTLSLYKHFRKGWCCQFRVLCI
jgi:hypothetical protein